MFLCKCLKAFAIQKWPTYFIKCAQVYDIVYLEEILEHKKETLLV